MGDCHSTSGGLLFLVFNSNSWRIIEYVRKAIKKIYIYWMERVDFLNKNYYFLNPLIFIKCH
jgi:hypothetical protein